MNSRRTTSRFLALVLGLSSQMWLDGERRCHAEGATDAGVSPSDAGGGADAGPMDAGLSSADAGPLGITPPKLLDGRASGYPPEAAAAKVTGVIGLILTIDATGRVTDAHVVDPLENGVDEVARSAVLQFRFEPARRDGKPIAARIRLAYVIAPERPVPAAVAAAPSAPQSSAAAPPAPPTRAPVASEVVEVTVRGASVAQRMRESAEAVTVVETLPAQRETGDLGEVLARTQGVSVRRGGGLGSYSRISLNGLIDDQIRFFLDGVPLDVAGFGLGLQNVPVNLVERIEIYRGVVPIRFGADALGGAVNLVSFDDVRGAHAAASMEVGSFGTYRLTLSARHAHAPTGLYAAINAFLDHSDNNYPIDVEVPDDRGRLSPARVYRFHDAYDAYGIAAEVGVSERPWARRLALRVFATRQDQQIQNNLVMSVPYGEAAYWESVQGATLRYDQPRIRGSTFGVQALVAASHRTTDFRDLSPFVYDWFGRRIRQRVRPGEIGDPTNQRIWQDGVLARVTGTWAAAPGQALRLAIAPTLVERTGHDAIITVGRDPLSAQRHYFALISGAEHQLDLINERLEAITFGKAYLFDARTEESLPGGIFRHRDQDSQNLGFGESIRFRLARPVWLKASYERATRLPSTDELFGNGVLILANLGLVPELSHNGNLSVTTDVRGTRAGDFRGEVNLFIRQAQNLIVLLGNDMTFSYQNVFTARSQGVEGEAGWTSPGGYLALDGNVTYQSLRNRSTAGTFADFDGDRIPNRPWLFVNASARARKTHVSAPRDELTLGYYLRYVHDFFRGWESLGLREFKQVIPSQTTHALALTYLARGAVTQTWTAEVDNLTDAKAYDFFGVQRPGRAFYVKVTAEY